MRVEAEAELLAPRADVWAFLAEPFHLADWWPGISGVQPDRRGFAPGARWQVQGSRWVNPFVGRRPSDQLLLVREIDEYERFGFHLLADRLDVEVRIRAAAADRTLVRVAVEGSWLVGARRALAQDAVERLHALVQTAAA